MVLERFFNNYFTKWSLTSIHHEQQTSSQSDNTVVFAKEDLEAFLNIMKDPIVNGFLNIDTCYTLADKYLIAMAFVYLKRAGIPRAQYDKYNFFLALYLAHDMEEDEEDEKQSIFPWLLGKCHTSKDEETFQTRKNELWKAMDYRANVSLSCCKKVMDMIPENDVWKRERDLAHSGALRPYSKEPKCKQCQPLPPDPYPYPCRSCCCEDEDQKSTDESDSTTSLESSDDDNDSVEKTLYCDEYDDVSDEEYYQPQKKIRTGLEE